MELNNTKLHTKESKESPFSSIPPVLTPSTKYQMITQPQHNTNSFTIANILVHCLHIRPQLNNELVRQILDSLELTRRGTAQTIICGDFNARMGSFTSDHSSNSRGLAFLHWIQTNELIVWNKRLQHGKYTCIRHSGSSIVDYFLSTNELMDPSFTICDDLSLDSDHKMMVDLDFQLQHVTQQPIVENPRLIWHLGKLHKEPHRQRYISTFQQESDIITSTFMDSEQQPTTRDEATRFNENFSEHIMAPPQHYNL